MPLRRVRSAADRRRRLRSSLAPRSPEEHGPPTTVGIHAARRRVPRLRSLRRLLPRESDRARSRLALLPLFLAVHHALHVVALAPEVLAHRAPEARVDEVMDAVRQRRQEPAHPLVLAARARFEARDLALDALFDRVVIANIEVQKRVFLGRAPGAAVERVGAREVERARDHPTALVGREDDLHVLFHAIANLAEESSVQVPPAPAKLVVSD